MAHEVALENGNDDMWICVFGNRPHTDGFYTCDARGDEVEPI